MGVPIYINFTHCDLDGLGCSIVLKIAKGHDFTRFYCDYQGEHEINSEIQDFLDNIHVYGKAEFNVYITDIGVNEEIAELLNMMSMKSNFHVKLIDHHETNLWLNKYAWASVITEIDGEPTSATRLCYDILARSTSPIYESFVKAVTYRDTAKWITGKYDLDYDEDAAKYSYFLNEYMFMHGRDDLYNELSEFIIDTMIGISYDVSLTSFIDSMTYNNISEKRKLYPIYKQKKLASVYITDTLMEGYMCGVLFATHDVSELGYDICHDLGVDFAFMINTERECVELRCIRDDIHLGKWAKTNFGGGGHQKAAGFPLTKDMLFSIISNATNIIKGKDGMDE